MPQIDKKLQNVNVYKNNRLNALQGALTTLTTSTLLFYFVFMRRTLPPFLGSNSVLRRACLTLLNRLIDILSIK